MFSQKVFAIYNLIGLCAAGPSFGSMVFKRAFNEANSMDLEDRDWRSSSAMLKRGVSQQDMCERTSAMFAIRSCRAYCMKNYNSFPDECGLPGSAKTVVEMANQMRKMVTLDYCQTEYDGAIQKCLSMLS